MVTFAKVTPYDILELATERNPRQMPRSRYEFQLSAKPGGAHLVEVLVSPSENGLTCIQITMHARGGTPWDFPENRSYASVARWFLDSGLQHLADRETANYQRHTRVYEGNPRTNSRPHPWNWYQFKRTELEG